MNDRKDTGVFAALQPVSGIDRDIDYFKIYVVNNTPHSLELRYRLLLDEDEVKNSRYIAASRKFAILPMISFEELNNAPLLFFDLVLKDEVGNLVESWSNLLKLKPKVLLAPLEEAPVLNLEVYLFPLAKNQPKKKKPEPQEVLPQIDAQLLKERMMEGRQVASKLVVRASSRELDLHIEKLVADHSRMSNTEIITIQLDQFKKHMDKAIADNIDTLYVIHGIGKGRLREEISRLLKHYPQVRSFNNNYHGRYGFGATEVKFR